VVSDDPGAGALVEVVADGAEEGDVDIGGQTWQRLTTGRGETAFLREDDGVTVAVTGSASDDELRAVAAAVEPYSP
jgi:anti-sigma factor RsiW